MISKQKLQKNQTQVNQQEQKQEELRMQKAPTQMVESNNIIEANKSEEAEKIEKCFITVGEEVNKIYVFGMENQIFFHDGASKKANSTQVKEAVLNVIGITNRLKNKSGKRPSVGEMTEAIVRLSETANAYIDTHRDTFMYQLFGDLAEKRKIARNITKISDAFFKIMDGMGDDFSFFDSLQEVQSLNLDYDKKVVERITNFHDIYKKLGEHISYRENGERDKIKEKLSYFQPYENDFKILLARRAINREKFEKKVNDKAQYMLNLYVRYTRQERVITKLEQNEEIKDSLSDIVDKVVTEHAEEWNERGGEKKLTKEDADSNLTKEQLHAINEIDKWFLENWNNGGFAALFNVAKNEHGEIVAELFKKTKRERMFIYYLIQSGHRKEPTALDVYRSQTEKLDINEFKRKMEAHWLKLHRRLTGDYINMNKLTESLEANRVYKDHILQCNKIAGDLDKANERRGKKKPIDKNLPIEKQYKVALENFIVVGLAYQNISEQLNAEKDKKKDKKKIKNLTDTQTATAQELEECRKALVDLNHEIAEIKSDAAVEESDQEEEVTEAREMAGFVVGSIVNNVSAIKYIASLSDSTIAKINLATTNTTGVALSSINSIVSTALGIYSHVESLAEQHWGDKIAGFVEFGNGILDVATSVAENVETIKKFTEIGEQVLDTDSWDFSQGTQTLGLVTSSASLAINSYKLISKGLDVRNAKNAKEVIDKKYKGKGEVTAKDKQRRYEENMARLVNAVSKRRTVYSSIDFAVSGANMVGVFIPGVGQVMAIAGLGITLATTILKAISTGKVQTAIFDNYFNFPKCLEKAKLAVQKTRTIVNVSRFEEELRRRLAAKEGYSDMSSAATQIAKKYADFFYTRLFESPAGTLTADEKKAYINMIKGFGLPYDEEKKKPDKELLARSLTGKI